MYNTSQLNPLLQALLDKVILPAVNQELSAGLPLPTLGPLQLVSPQVDYTDGFVSLATGFEFNISRAAKMGLSTDTAPAMPN